MIKHAITYKNFRGEEVFNELWFNLSKAEILKLQAQDGKDLEATLREVAASNDPKLIIDKFTEIVLLAWGEISEDGEEFVKSEAARARFANTAAFDAFLGELLSYKIDPIEFLKGVLPGDLEGLAEAEEEARRQLGPQAQAALDRSSNHPSLQGFKRKDLRVQQNETNNVFQETGAQPSTEQPEPVVAGTAEPQLEEKQEDYVPPSASNVVRLDTVHTLAETAKGRLPVGVTLNKLDLGDGDVRLFLAYNGRNTDINVEDLQAIQDGTFEWPRLWS